MEFDPNRPDQGTHPVPATPAGWYPDPSDPNTQRYWDGARWTENRSPGAVTLKLDTNGKAIAAMVLGILWLCGIGSILALVFGYQAQNEIEASAGKQGGKGMAIAGIVLGWIGVGLILLYLVLWLIFGITALSLDSTSTK